MNSRTISTHIWKGTLELKIQRRNCLLTLLPDTSFYITKFHYELVTPYKGNMPSSNFADQYGIKLKAFNADNHPFGKIEITDNIKLQDQTISFSGVGVHFQNGVAERAIQIVISWSMFYMMHQLLYWPSCFQDDLWPFALDHAINVWNHLPSQSGLSPSPIELFTRIKWPHHDLISNAKVWGYPIYVLDPTLQDSKCLPKWTLKSHLGMHMRSSPAHSETVAQILSLKTGYVSA